VSIRDARTARTLARGTFIGSLVLALVGAAIAIVTEPSQLVVVVGLSVAVVIYGGVGMLMASKHRSNPLGWLFCGIGATLGSLVFALAYANIGSPGGMGAGTAPASDAASWFVLIVPPAVLGFSLPAFLLLFPDGRLLSRRWKAGVALAGAASVFWIFGIAANSDQDPRFPGPGWIEAIPLAHDFVGVALGAIAVAALAGFASLVVRYRAAEGEARTQLQFLTLMLGAMAVASALIVPLSWPGFVLAVLVDGFGVLVGIPAATAVAVLTFGLYDVGFVLRKGIVSGLLTAAFVALFALIVFVFGGMTVGAIGPADSPIGLTVRGLVIGLAVGPLRRLAVGLSKRIVFGERATPYQVLTTFSERLGETYATDDVLVRLAGLLVEAVGAREVGVWVRLGDLIRLEASVPARAAATVEMAEAEDDLPDTLPGHTFEVRDRGELLGAITVLMPANDPMNKAKEGLVRDLASQAGLVLRNVQLIGELRESRRRIVAAQDERARKLERDIHDGAQQQLVALAVRQRLAASLIGTDDAGARRMLEQLQTQTNETLEDLRDLARGIYPPLLADKGLPAALEAQARKGVVPVVIEPNGVGRYPQQIESAVYFSVLEALQNVAKYANATRATVCLSDDGDRLMFEVTDDGRGFDPTRIGYGTGLQGIADRLAALDGSLKVVSAPGEGTTLAGRISVQA
jgi:signal transduction histidine kinase